MYRSLPQVPTAHPDLAPPRVLKSCSGTWAEAELSLLRSACSTGSSRSFIPCGLAKLSFVLSSGTSCCPSLLPPNFGRDQGSLWARFSIQCLFPQINRGNLRQTNRVLNHTEHDRQNGTDLLSNCQLLDSNWRHQKLVTCCSCLWHRSTASRD
jgi:hypothetical protein